MIHLRGRQAGKSNAAYVDLFVRIGPDLLADAVLDHGGRHARDIVRKHLTGDRTAMAAVARRVETLAKDVIRGRPRGDDEKVFLRWASENTFMPVAQNPSTQRLCSILLIRGHLTGKRSPCGWLAISEAGKKALRMDDRERLK